MGNAPDGNWYFVEVMRHTNAGNYYVIQRATGMAGAVANQVYQRSQQSGSAGVGWGTWVQQGGLGVGQTWQNVTASRALNITYTNTTEKPIAISVIGGAPVDGSSSATLYVDGIEVNYYTTSAYNGPLTAVIPKNSTYRVIGSNWGFSFGAPYGWRELR